MMKRVILNNRTYKRLLIEEKKLDLMKSAKMRCKIDNTSCYYFLDYIAKTTEEHASQKAERTRDLIWIFKDHDGRNKKDYQIIYDFVVNNLCDLLTQSFGERLKELTLVCIPAATKEYTDNRWKEFSKDICKRLGMKNGFSHITIIKDAVPNHYNGGGKPKIELDKDFFYDKNIILFDDIINTGDSMTRYKTMLEDVGADIIQFIAIARNKE